jgi:tetratricopeptide (TPR) repeat protein
MHTQRSARDSEFEAASRSYRDGNLRDAADAFARIVASDPEHHDAVRHLGLIAHRIGNHDQAAELLSQAILIKPDFAAAFADLALVLRALGRHEYALKALETAIAMGSCTANAFGDLAELHEALGRHDDAARARRMALKLPARNQSSAPVRADIPAHWRQVQLVLIEPDNYPHMAGLADLVAAFRSAFAELGVHAEIVRNKLSTDRMNIVFGAHLIDGRVVAEGLPANTVLVNLEQLRGNNLKARSSYADLLRRFAVWDHSERNIAELKALAGTSRVHRIGIGFAPGMQTIAPQAEQTTDVLFYGSLNERRRAILKALEEAGLRVQCLYGVYGAERDQAIAGAKVVLNIHFYADSIHEIVRTSHLLANRKAVVCECNADTEIDEDIRQAVAAVRYDQLAETCIALVRDDARRRELEQAGFAIFSRRSQAAMLAEAIAETSPPLPRTINLGSGKAWSPSCLNIDIDPKWEPDLLADVSDPAWVGRAFVSSRFGVQRLLPESFDTIVTTDVLEHVPNLPAFMTS